MPMRGRNDRELSKQGPGEVLVEGRGTPSRCSIRVDRNFRVTFGWSDAGPHAIDVDDEDYH